MFLIEAGMMKLGRLSRGLETWSEIACSRHCFRLSGPLAKLEPNTRGPFINEDGPQRDRMIWARPFRPVVSSPRVKYLKNRALGPKYH